MRVKSLLFLLSVAELGYQYPMVGCDCSAAALSLGFGTLACRCVGFCASFPTLFTSHFIIQVELPKCWPRPHRQILSVRSSEWGVKIRARERLWVNAGVSIEDDKRCYTAHLTRPHRQHSTLFAIREFYSAGPVWQTMGVVDEAKALRRGGGG